jgi:arginase
MADAALAAELPYPETATVECGSLAEQTQRIASALPARPLVVGGCCCAHTGAIRGLAERGMRLGVVWLDAHGDLNTPETSPTGNAWGMPLRAALDGGWVRPDDLALVGARNLDPPEVAYAQAAGIDDDVERALEGTDAVYVALDTDVLDPGEFEPFMPEPDGLRITEVESLLRAVASRGDVAGLGLTAFLPAADTGVLARLAAAGLGA